MKYTNITKKNLKNIRFLPTSSQNYHKTIPDKSLKMNQKIKKRNILKDFEFDTKLILKIIYQFHFYRKKILFIGDTVSFKNNFFFKCLKKTKHIHIFSDNWIPGVVKNKDLFLEQMSTVKNLKFDDYSTLVRSKKIKISLNLIKKPALIVILDPKIKIEILKEIKTLHVPILSFNKISTFKNLLTSNYLTTDNSLLLNNKLLILYSAICGIIIRKTRQPKLKMSLLPPKTGKIKKKEKALEKCKKNILYKKKKKPGPHIMLKKHITEI